MKRLIGIFVMGALLFSSQAVAQRLSVEVHPVVAFPVENLAGADLGTGIGAGAAVHIKVMNHLGVYGGWDWLHFASGNSFAGGDSDFEETGYTYGVRFQHPLRGEEQGVACRLEIGGTYKHIEIENSEGAIIDDSGHRVGLDVGAGISVPVNSSISFAPVLRYRSLASNFDQLPVATSAMLRYAAIELNFAIRF